MVTTQESSKIVLLLGANFKEGVTTKIKALGHTYLLKQPLSTPANWEKIAKSIDSLINKDELLAAFFHMTEATLFQCSRPEYQSKLNRILERLKKVPCLIFIYENNLSGDFTLLKWQSSDNAKEQLETFRQMIRLGSESGSSAERAVMAVFDKIQQMLNFKAEGIAGSSEEYFLSMVLQEKYLLEKYSETLIQEIGNSSSLFSNIETMRVLLNRINKFCSEKEEKFKEIEYALGIVQDTDRQDALKVIRICKDSGIEIVPYKRSVELTTRIQQFLDDIANGIFLHLYIPNGRYQADQLDGFLRLFENYLKSVEKVTFSIDTRKTMHGRVYMFKSDGELANLGSMNDAIARFEDFMELCQNKPREAEALLRSIGMNSSDTSSLIFKYTKEYHRLILDMKHELEHKFLDFQKRVLSLRQSLENEAFDIETEEINTNYRLEQFMSKPEIGNARTHLPLTNSASSIMYHFPKLSNNKIEAITEEIMIGDITYSMEDKLLIEMFNKYASAIESLQLKSDLEQFKDTSSQKELRVTAKQKLSSFLFKNSAVVGEEMTNLLLKYLENLL